MTELRDARDLERLVQRALVVHVVHGSRRRLERERIRLDQVSTPHLDRVHPELGGHQVHRPLHERDRLRPSGASVRRHRRRVRHHRPATRRDRRDPVDAGEHLRRGRRQERADRVRPHVGQQVHAHAADVPSRLAPISTAWTCARPCVIETRFSERDFAYRTGHPSFRAAAATTANSGYTIVFAPNPPPTSGAIVRTRLLSTPSVSARSPRASNGTCVEAQTV